ncbi:MAG TPA: hypothetical protein PK760_00055 [Flavobacteriales bacterium]|nr:hypothetical protein [Flavobacteriales bacterium]
MPRLLVHSSHLARSRVRASTTLAVMVCCAFAQAQVIDSTYILAVDRHVHEIDSAKDYEIRTLENEEFLEQMTDGGGELTGMLKNGELLKVDERVGLSSCVEVTEYYFENSQLVFVSAQGLEFAYVDSTGSFDPGVQHVTMEGRFYYRKGDAAPVLLKGSTRCGGAPTKEWAAVYRTEAKRLKDLLMR